jgi:hypothetical protein
VTRCTLMISRPRPTIRSTSSGRAAWSGSSARRVVVSGVVVTWQSSNCARSVLPAGPLKVISYVCDRTGNMPRSWWLTLAVRVPDSEVRVVTRYRVIGLAAVAAAGLHRAVGTSEAWQPAPAVELPVGLPSAHRAYAGQDRARLGRSPGCAGHLQWASLDEVLRWRACESDAAGGVITHGGRLRRPGVARCGRGRPVAEEGPGLRHVGDGNGVNSVTLSSPPCVISFHRPGRACVPSLTAKPGGLA